MKLIADSGSSKTDWRAIHTNGTIKQYKSGGINPFYQDEDEISEELAKNLKPQVSDEITEIYFYGAGCVNEEKNVLGNSSL